MFSVARVRSLVYKTISLDNCWLAAVVPNRLTLHSARFLM
jgi:hypothetical protein